MLDSNGDTSNYQPNGEFELEGYTPERHEVFYSCCPEPYIDVTYTIRLRRRPMFYVFNLILPCILINTIGKKRKYALKYLFWDTKIEDLLPNNCEYF